MYNKRVCISTVVVAKFELPLGIMYFVRYTYLLLHTGHRSHAMLHLPMNETNYVIT